MKNVIVRRVDELGRITLPKTLLHYLGINGGDSFEIGLDGETITLKLYSQNKDYEQRILGLISFIEQEQILENGDPGTRAAMEKALYALREAFTEIHRERKNKTNDG